MRSFVFITLCSICSILLCGIGSSLAASSPLRVEILDGGHLHSPDGPVDTLPLDEAKAYATIVEVTGDVPCADFLTGLDDLAARGLGSFTLEIDGAKFPYIFPLLDGYVSAPWYRLPSQYLGKELPHNDFLHLAELPDCAQRVIHIRRDGLKSGDATTLDKIRTLVVQEKAKYKVFGVELRTARGTRMKAAAEVLSLLRGLGVSSYFFAQRGNEEGIKAKVPMPGH